MSGMNNERNKKISVLWVPDSSTGKVFYGCIRDLEFNFRIHQKQIDVLV